VTILAGLVPASRAADCPAPDINRAAAHGGEGALRRAVEALLAAHPYGLVPSNRPLEETYLGPIQDCVKPLLNMIRDDAAKHHATLDSPASYAATQAMCQHW
jgi:hypothetical protein